MGGISKSRIVLATAVPVVFASYLLLMGITWWYFVIVMFLVILCDLIYLTSILIKTMKPLPNSLSISGKNIIITGGSSGIGFQLAKELVKSNAAHIILIARKEERLLRSVSELNETKADFQQISHISLDLTSNDVKEKIDDLLKTIKRIDILISCAGFSLPVEFLSLKLNQFKQMIDVNYLGSVNITHAVTPYMCKQKFGQLVFLSSVAGQLGVYGLTAYSPSKYAIRGFAETLYHEVLPYGVGITLVFPPDTDTPGFEHENTMKPKLTKIISEQAGLWKSEDVAKIIKEGIINRRFMLGFGSDGFFLNALTGGATPASSVFEFWAHCLLMPFVKIYMLFLQTYFMYLIQKEYNANENGNISG